LLLSDKVSVANIEQPIDFVPVASIPAELTVEGVTSDPDQLALLSSLVETVSEAEATPTVFADETPVSSVGFYLLFFFP
jgi:hypothetical protein